MSALLPEELEHLVLMATYAPSVHNTQPWRFSPAPDGLLVQRDRTRQLDVIDPDGRELLISCGAALHHLQVAARAIGVDAEVAVDVHDDAVAQVTLTRGQAATEAEVANAVTILHRHTYRGRFTDDPVTPEELDRVRLAAESEHGLIRIVHDSELVGVQVAVSRAERSLHDLPGYQQELNRWVWHGVPDENRGDGLPYDALDHDLDRADSLEGRHFEGRRPRPVEPPAPEHPSVLLLSSPGDTPADWVQSGRALSALLLAATDEGLLAQPISQVIELPSSRHALGHLLSTVGVPQLLLRLGHGVSTPVTPRRPVTDVLNP